MREEKQLLLEQIQEKLDPVKGFILMSYDKLEANLIADFRSSLRKGGGELFVVKKRVLKKAAEAQGLDGEVFLAPGHIGFVSAQTDFIGVSKALFDFRKANANLIEVIGGRFEDKPCSSEDVKLLASLPGKDQMRAELLGLFEAPMSMMLGAVEAVLSGVVSCLDQKASKES